MASLSPDAPHQHIPDFWKLVMSAAKPPAWRWEKRCRTCHELLMDAPARANGTALQNFGLVDKDGYLVPRDLRRGDKLRG